MRITEISAIWLALVSMAVAADAQAAVRKSTLISAQSLAPALETLAKERDFQILYVTSVVNELRTNGAVGELTVDEALKELLAGTGLTFRYVDQNTLTVLRQQDAATAGASSSMDLGDWRQDPPDSGARWPQELLSRLSVGEEISKRRTPNLGVTGTSSTTSDADRREYPATESDTRTTRLSEIVVTATRREARLQDVPLSITAITGDEIDRRRLVSAEDYLRGMPGVNQLDNAYGQAVVIRGITTATEDQNFLGGATVATYFGETPTTNSAGTSGGSNIDIKLVDIERVEVLRGPQGTAFGNASMGGAVRVIPVAPKIDTLEGKVYAGYSVTSGTGGDNYNVQGVGNIPLIKDKLAIRGTIYHYQDSGFFSNRAGSDPNFQADVVTPFGAEAFAVDEEEIGDYYVLGGRVATLFQATDDLRFTVSYLSQKIEVDGYPVATVGTYEQTVLQVPPEHVARGEKEGIFDKDIDIANAMVEHDLGWGDLLATYSYIDSGTLWSASWTGLPFPWPISTAGPSDHREHVGEIRLATKLDGAWDFLAGLYYEELNDEVVYDFRWYGDPATNFFAPGETFLGSYLDQRNLEQIAAFGEGSWEFLKGVTLTGGVRAYEYDRTYRVDATGAFYGADGIHVDEDDDASGTIFRANLSYKPNDNALLYTSWSEGFRLGQLTTGVPPAVCDLDGDGIVDGTDSTVESTRQVDPDEVESYELGGKFAVFDQRLAVSVALFRMDWSDVPVTVNPQAVGGCNWDYVANAGEARSDGIELQGSIQISDTLRVDFGSAYIDATTTEDVPAIGASKGDRLPGSPEWTANLGAQYGMEIGGYQTFLRADAIYVGRFFNDLLESGEAGDYVKLDASARVTIGNAYVELFGRNLTDADEFTKIASTPTSGYPLRPRTIGLQVGFSF